MCLGCEVRERWGADAVNIGVPGPEQMRRTALVFQSCHNKISQQGWPTKQARISPQFWRLKVQGQGYWQGWFLVRPLSLAARRLLQGPLFLASLCVLRWPFLYAHTRQVSSYRD